MEYLRVKGWANFQHYKDRSPPWIKLHRELLRDYDFSCLQDASKLHLMLIWLLASQLDNKIPNDPAWIQRQIGTENPPNLKLLISSGFIVLEQDDSGVIAPCKQSALVETEAETEAETEQPMGDSPSASPPRSKSDPAEKEFEQLWTQYPRRAGSNPKRDALKAYRATRKRGSQFADIEAGLRRYIRFCEATGKIGTETVMQAKTFFGPSDRWSEEWLLPKRGAADKPKLDPKGARPGESWEDYEKRMIREQARA